MTSPPASLICQHIQEMTGPNGSGQARRRRKIRLEKFIESWRVSWPDRGLTQQPGDRELDARLVREVLGVEALLLEFVGSDWPGPLA